MMKNSRLIKLKAMKNFFLGDLSRGVGFLRMACLASAVYAIYVDTVAPETAFSIAAADIRIIRVY